MAALAGVHHPLASALVTAPVLMLVLWLFAAARVALVLAARGVPPAAALVHGLDVVLRRLPSLVRLSGAIAWYPLPLTVPALVLRAAGAQAGGAAALCRGLSLAFFELAALVGYAALANLVGRDPRLTTG
jgi:hypothetical protein